MLGVVEGDYGEDWGGTSESDAVVVTSDSQDGASGGVRTGDVSVVEVDYLDAVGATAAYDAVLAFAVVLKMNDESLKKYIVWSFVLFPAPIC